MTISVQRTVIVEPQVTQVMIIVGSNDHLQSRGLLTRIDESLCKFGHAKFFTTLNLGSAFWRVSLRMHDW